MVAGNQKWGFLQVIFSLFPFHLLLAQLKYNLLALFYWIFLFLIISDNLGSAFGIPILFYSPEYLGATSFWSFLFLGFGIGGFTMGFNTYSYIRLAPRFPFLNTLNQPFYKFCLNNGILPLLFNLYFIFRFCRFQVTEEYASSSDLFGFISAYLLGFALFQLISVLYFFPMNKRIGRKISPNFKPHQEKTVKTVIPNKESKVVPQKNNSTRVYLYLGKSLKFYSSRSGRHYKKDLLIQIYKQNKVNATLFETIAILSFLALGFLQGSRFFELPAAVSIVLLLTIVLMLFSSLLSYLNRWAYPVIILVFISLNYLSTKTRFFTFKNYAYGLSYEKSNEVPYTLIQIQKTAENQKNIEVSKANALSILKAWKTKTGEKKPKLVFLNVSGGGSRSALWVVNCLQQLDKETQQKFSLHTQMVTGASGGMIGASFYRQLRYLEKKNKISDLYSETYRKQISDDLLNRLSFLASTNDIFFRYKTFEKNNISYPIDRGTAFEEQLNENTKGILDVNLSYYDQLEKEAEMPLHIFSPTIVNDGRRLLISSQKLTYLTNTSAPKIGVDNSYENIDYMSFFEKSSPEKIRFTSVMRSSATFPFVMPMVTLPTSPDIQLMDAGIRDNYGGKVTAQYILALEDWIAKNTSGVVIVQIRDTKKILQNETSEPVSLFRKFTMPFGNMYSNFPRTQDFNQDELFTVLAKNMHFPVDVISFNLREDSRDKISLSWHLTRQEKIKIKKAFDRSTNQNALIKLKKLLSSSY